MRNFYIRPIEDGDETFLWEMLYQALYVPEGVAPIPREVLAQPELAHYVSEWGQPADGGMFACAQVYGAGAGQYIPRFAREQVGVTGAEAENGKHIGLCCLNRV